ncbi:TlpA disulfide reductase family protein [Virgibacillus salarius]|uniref:peroxiredoxin family protein n=1 Tax=Virgibacillus salarius TaxID=447199 RepID=UPI0024933008|nr:TlpA disulfide reductase family protein [Virgibacillus salarius]WBX80412.1 TlpA disulfide reductase family protein [Virgibacillus salarius]
MKRVTLYLPLLVAIITIIYMLYIIAEQPSTTNDTKQESVSVSSDNSPSDIDEGLQVGKLAPDFTLKGLDGKKYRLSDFRGKKVMLNFWASWCPPCRDEMPAMQRFYQDKDVVLLAVNLTSTERKKSDVTNFIKQYKLTFPILLDEAAEVSDRYQIKPIPTTYLIDSKGHIQYKAFGAMSYELMIQEFQKLE